ncbi:MAG: hypothetical protein MRZ79_21960 [Bacteroidia bacterium]|nr:hypothetical protein [Bacteroidia bacterium]
MPAALIFLPIFLLIPGVLIHFEKRLKIIQWLSVAFWCYVLGIILGNVWEVPRDFLHTMTDTTVALAIPILLFSANVPQWLRLAKPTAISYGLYLIALISMALVVRFIGSKWVEFPAMSASMTATVWTGGTPNMTAVGKMIGASEDILIPGITLTDLMLSGMLLILVLSVLHSFYRLYLPAFQHSKEASEESDEDNFGQLSLKQKFINVLISLLIGGLCLGIIAGLSILIFGEINLIFVMIGLTLTGMAVSFIPRIRKMPGTYETGEYIFLIFCIAIGATTNIEAFLQKAVGLTAFMGSILVGTLLIHSFLARIFKIDADTVMITLVSGVFSTPFIGPVANRLQNREIVVSGLTLSAINFAIGNFVGLGLWSFLG